MFCTQGHNQWVESSLNISSVFIFIVLSIFKKMKIFLQSVIRFPNIWGVHVFTQNQL